MIDPNSQPQDDLSFETNSHGVEYVIIDEPGDTTVRPARPNILRGNPRAPQSEIGSVPKSDSGSQPCDTPPYESASLGCEIIIIDEPGDTTVRPRRPNIPLDPPRPRQLEPPPAE